MAKAAKKKKAARAAATKKLASGLLPKSSINSTLTVESSLIHGGEFGVWIGGKWIKPEGKVTGNQYWFVVIDRKTLKVVFNHLQTSGTTVPTGLKQYDSDEYILAFASYDVNTLNVPQGKLYDFLLARGGGSQLRRLAQIVNDLGCGFFMYVAYTLVSVLGYDTLGFELGNIQGDSPPILTLELLATDVPGHGTLYTPVTLPN